MEKIYKQLSVEERTMIQAQLSMGFKLGQIARELGRSAGTLSRELKGNGREAEARRYLPDRSLSVDRSYSLRAPIPKPRMGT